MKPYTKSGSGGRPTQEETQLSGKILDVAQSLFLRRVSSQPRAIKLPTLPMWPSARFADKESAFDAVIKRCIDQNLLEIDSLDLQGLKLEDKFLRLAYLLLEHALEPEAIGLDRAITAEAARFPISHASTESMRRLGT